MPNVAKSTYFENLDGLRFFAFLLVFISHAALFLGLNSSSDFFKNFKHYFLVNGEAGVAFFFVLSGFLITYLLCKEKEIRGSIDLKNFHLRRIKRIWPVYFLVLFLGFIVLPLFYNDSFPVGIVPGLWELPYFLTFLSNFKSAFLGGGSMPLDILWAISVEVQFYAIWSLVINWLPRKHLLKAIITMIVLAFIYRFNGNEATIAYSTFSVMSDLGIGALLAYMVLEKNHLIEKWSNVKKRDTALIYALLFAVIIGKHFVLRATNGYPEALFALLQALWPLLLSIIFALIILEQNLAKNSWFKMSRFKKISDWGRISYGLYSYHTIAFILILVAAQSFGLLFPYDSIFLWILLLMVSFIAAISAAYISSRTLEKFFAKKKD